MDDIVYFLIGHLFCFWKAGDKRWGTDENEFVDIFSSRSRPHLRAVFKEFKKVISNIVGLRSCNYIMQLKIFHNQK